MHREAAIFLVDAGGQMRVARRVSPVLYPNPGVPSWCAGFSCFPRLVPDTRPGMQGVRCAMGPRRLDSLVPNLATLKRERELYFRRNVTYCARWIFGIWWRPEGHRAAWRDSRFPPKKTKVADGEEPMTDKTIDLDKRRGMSAQKETKLRRLHAEVREQRDALRVRQDALEEQLVAAPAQSWEEAAEKARYLLHLFAASIDAQDPRRQKLITAVLDDFARLSAEPSDAPTEKS